jgi:hypothetical protein
VQVESKLQDLGLVLPDAPKVPPGFKFSFAWTRVYDGRLYLSGHGAQAPDDSYIGPFGKVPSEVSLEEAQEAARNTALSMLSSIKRELGDLDRVRAWLMVHGMVNAENLVIRRPPTLSMASQTSSSNCMERRLVIMRVLR